jgi:two-component system, LytTR family, response regulator
VRDIDWIEAADNYVCIHCGAETHVARETMNAMETRLDPSEFVRIHRSTIVNIDRIERLQPWFRGDYLVIMRGGKQLTMSRTYREKLQDTLLKTL